MRQAYGGGAGPYAGGGWGRINQWPSARRTQGDPLIVDFRWILRPISWLRWRREVRRDGPYAPDFAEFRRQHRRRP